MNTISFVGITGTILESSPHGNYLVVELSKRITICGTYSNQFDWEISPEEQSGFESFITYIGLNSSAEFDKIKAWVIKAGGYFDKSGEKPRPSKRVRHFPLEIKVRGLPAKSVAKLAKAPDCLS
ncbi:hypothetical protein [Microcoleus sp. FACHB-672]|uniref:hypothetical protein n=1 Tax=Microcoleus sp. FACHB-672 TaxID=2692825 RepID=UPI001689C2AD|nr:hypothetical protein [Microcoleus sp. FACHB-672]MBD2039232.1 hypothetical protein [Microcoleus sp. FACHB-672]